MSAPALLVCPPVPSGARGRGGPGALRARGGHRLHPVLLSTNGCDEGDSLAALGRVMLAGAGSIVLMATPASQILSTTAGDLPLEEYRLALGGQAWTILHTGAILSHEDEDRFLRGDQPRLPYGIALWPAAIALAHDMAARSLQGLRVLELGAGTGLPGIVAATLGATVVQTDRNAAALVVCRRNAERNGVLLEQRAADWTAWHEAGTYDYIIGADILYAESVHPQLRQIFDANLAPGGRLLLSDPFRPASFELLEAMAASGWNVVFNKWTVGVVPPPRPVGVFELTRRS